MSESINTMPEAARQHRHAIREKALLIIIIGDLIFLFLGQVLGFLARFEWGPLPRLLHTAPHAPWDYSGHYILGTLLGSIILGWLGIYQLDGLLRLRRGPLVLAKGITYWVLSYLLITLFVRFQPEVSRIYVFLAGIHVFILLSGWRWMIHEWIKTRTWRDDLRERVMIVGDSRYVRDLLRAIKMDPHHPYQLIGVAVGAENDSGLESIPEHISYQSLDELQDIIEKANTEIVVVGNSNLSDTDIHRISEFCARELIRFKTIPTQFQFHLSGLTVSTISGVPVLGVDILPIERLVNRAIKRVFDLAGACVGLLISAPLIAILAIAIRRESSGPVFYPQIRCGRGGSRFTMWKLRSMKPEAEKDGVGWTQPNDSRVLKVGQFMRRWNLDELPQFWNVFKGEMSLVGPRPERPEYIERFKEEIRFYNLRHGVKPGMTGWAQINGLRGDTDLSERLRYDFYYAENWSPWLDFYIMLMTLFLYKNAY
jgi:exopolysaccharide biosynthesis polyprenyl glycosylphosphotransferase